MTDDLSAQEVLSQLRNLRNDLADMKALMLRFSNNIDISNSKNPLNRFGYKVFSQSDEDGITLEIVRRIFGETPGTFCEYGVGDGKENNTLVLLAKGWSGAWFGNEDLEFEEEISTSRNLSYKKGWITLDTIRANIQEFCASEIAPDILSIDLDGNDYHFVLEILLSEMRPKVFIVEYNAKFLPGIDWVMPYREEHTWNNDDFFGASLTSFSKLFLRFGYRLICCNLATGANAYFVKDSEMANFIDVPSSESELWAPPNYIIPGANGHSQSINMIKSFLF